MTPIETGLHEEMEFDDGWSLKRRIAATAVQVGERTLDSEWQLWLSMQANLDVVGSPTLVFSRPFESGNSADAAAARAEVAKAELVLRGVVLFLNAGGNCRELLSVLSGVAALRPEPINLNGYEFVDSYVSAAAGDGCDVELVFVRQDTDSALIWSPGESVESGSARLWLASLDKSRVDVTAEVFGDTGAADVPAG